MDSAAETINQAAVFFREKKLPVVWIQNEDRESGIYPGTEGYDMIDALKSEPGEKRINKHYNNSFNKTDLLEYLQSEAVDTVIVTGYCAEYCVISTYQGATDLDLFPVFLKNAIAGGIKEHIQFVENIRDIVTLNVLKKMLAP
jgi:nicotinamidase-related amidase